MEKDQLRKCDLLTALIIIGFGVWVVVKGLAMPMTGSYGGVQNAWYISPALMPLFVGAMLAVLGIMLLQTALRNIGLSKARAALREILLLPFAQGLGARPLLGFAAMVSMLAMYVYAYIPKVDFFLASLYFLLVFILPFYLEELAAFRRLLAVFAVQTALWLLYLATGVSGAAREAYRFADDLAMILFILVFVVLSRRVAGSDGALVRKYRLGMVVALCVPIILCPAFKYFLLVPLPAEGLVTDLMDSIRYGLRALTGGAS